MNNKKILACLLAAVTLMGILLLPGCKSEPLVIKESDTCIVLKVTAPITRMAKATLSYTVILSIRRKSWKTTPTVRRR